MIGDLDPIKAARGGHALSDELNIHFGLLPRANRGIFAINELPDLMGKIQVGLFNIMQEGDVQIKGYPVRLPLDVLLVFTANPEDYTARGKIITPLKDRIGSEIRTHYPASLDDGIAITKQEAWCERPSSSGQIFIPPFIREIIETVAFLAREDRKIDKRSGVSQRLPISCMENVISNAERRALRNSEPLIVPRVGDIYAALPSITGKFELEYEGELRGADRVARELIRAAVGKVYDSHFAKRDMSQIIQWFEMGGSLKVTEDQSAADALEALGQIQGLVESASHATDEHTNDPAMQVSAAEFLLDGLHAHRRIDRKEEIGYTAEEKKREIPDTADFPSPRARRKYN
jgi:magnesium chelatase subunit I